MNNNCVTVTVYYGGFVNEYVADNAKFEFKLVDGPNGDKLYVGNYLIIDEPKKNGKTICTPISPDTKLKYDEYGDTTFVNGYVQVKIVAENVQMVYKADNIKWVAKRDGNKNYLGKVIVIDEPKGELIETNNMETYQCYRCDDTF